MGAQDYKTPNCPQGWFSVVAMEAGCVPEGLVPAGAMAAEYASEGLVPAAGDLPESRLSRCASRHQDDWCEFWSAERQSRHENSLEKNALLRAAENGERMDRERYYGLQSP